MDLTFPSFKGFFKKWLEDVGSWQVPSAPSRIKPLNHPRGIEGERLTTHQRCFRMRSAIENVESHPLRIQIFETSIGLLLACDMPTIIQLEDVAGFQACSSGQWQYVLKQ